MGCGMASRSGAISINAPHWASLWRNLAYDTIKLLLKTSILCNRAISNDVVAQNANRAT
jgi:hypothetical protein